MTRVYLIRHGEAEGNVYRRAHGRHDGKITAQGLRQIAALAERFKDEHIDALYSSDLSRTIATAGAITKYHDLEIVTEPRLREVNMGTWEDLPWGNIAQQAPEAMYCFNHDPDGWVVDFAETWPELKRRMYTAVTELAAKHQGQTIACVTHGTAIRALLSLIMGIKSRDIAQLPYGDNTAVSLLEIEGDRINIVFANDSSHLPEELSTFARQSWWKQDGRTADRNNLVLTGMSLQHEMEDYLRFYRQAWLVSHEDLTDFDEELYKAKALERRSKFFLSQTKAVDSTGRTVGVMDIDVYRFGGTDCGWICLLCVEEELRRQKLGVQLLGNVFYLMKGFGLKRVQLNVAESNTGAIAFYEEYGFRCIDRRQGPHGVLLLMERELG